MWEFISTKERPLQCTVNSGQDAMRYTHSSERYINITDIIIEVVISRITEKVSELTDD